MSVKSSPTPPKTDPKIGFSIDEIVGKVSKPESPVSKPQDVRKPSPLRFQDSPSSPQVPHPAFRPDLALPNGLPLSAFFGGAPTLPQFNPMLGQISSLGTTPMPPAGLTPDFPLYPWLLSRHSRLLGQRLHGNGKLCLLYIII